MLGASATIASASKFGATTVDHPRLNLADASPICVFLSAYDQYVSEVQEGARQLVTQDAVTTEIVNPVNLKFCVEAGWLQSTVILCFIDGVTTVEKLIDCRLRINLDGKSEESNDIVNLERRDEIVKKELRINMRDVNATSRIQNLFIHNMTILRRNGLSGIIKDNQKVAVYHVLSKIRPTSLQNRLESDLDFLYYDLRKGFKGFMAHCIRLSEAFQLVDNGKQRTDSTRTESSPSRSGGKSGRGGNRRNDGDSSFKNKTDKQLPVCLYGRQKSKGIRQLLHDCRDCPEDQKEALLKAYGEEKAHTSPSISIRSAQKQDAKSEDDKAKTMRRLQISSQSSTANAPTASSFSVNVLDGNESIRANGRIDDGIDVSIVSPKFAERAVLKGIGKMRKIDKVTLKVALNNTTEAQSFTLSRTWTTPKTVFQLYTGTLALLKVTLLVADDDLTVEDLFICLPVLNHLSIDKKTLLEQKRDLLDGIHCSGVRDIPNGNWRGHVSRLMLARLKKAGHDGIFNDNIATADAARPKVNYCDVRNQPDPFPDSSLLDPVDSDQHDAIVDTVEKMVTDANDNGLPDERMSELRAVVNDNIYIFRTSFSSRPIADFPPLKIELQRDAKPVLVRLRNYSQTQRSFLNTTISMLVVHGMAYPNPTSPWYSAPLLVPKPGTEGFLFTVGLLSGERIHREASLRDSLHGLLANKDIRLKVQNPNGLLA